MGWSGLGLACLGALASCGRAEEPFQARFTVRGRWPGERVLTYRVEPGAGPLGEEEFRRAIAAALALWEATGCVDFRTADGPEEPSVTYGWRRGAHGECPAFGADPGVAHAGPVRPGTFVHFDAEREWGRGGLSLEQAVLHETGHVLGLDHSPDPEATMHPEPSPARFRLAASDLAGIHSLYGGGRPSPGDLAVADGALVLRAVAPPELVSWTLFDVDGEGGAELVAWRNDAAGQGALWTYHFGPGPVLERASGPAYGVIGPGLTPALGTSARGERLLVLWSGEGVRAVRVFDERGTLRPAPGDLPLSEASLPRPSAVTEADLDGDGCAERVARRG